MTKGWREGLRRCSSCWCAYVVMGQRVVGAQEQGRRVPEWEYREHGGLMGGFAETWAFPGGVDQEDLAVLAEEHQDAAIDNMHKGLVAYRDTV